MAYSRQATPTGLFVSLDTNGAFVAASRNVIVRFIDSTDGSIDVERTRVDPITLAQLKAAVAAL